MGTEITKHKRSWLYYLTVYFLLFTLVSFFGWAFETAIEYLRTKELTDRGFLSLPFCPIYGSCILLIYFLLGTPNEGKGILENVENKRMRYSLYAIFAFLIPTVIEFFVGLIFDKLFQMRLWSYKSFVLNLNGYVCLPISIGWGVMVFLFMHFAFDRIMRLLLKIPKATAYAASIILFWVLIFDFTKCIIRI